MSIQKNKIKINISGNNSKNKNMKNVEFNKTSYKFKLHKKINTIINDNDSKSNLKMVGRATMSFGLIPLTSGIVALLCEEESIVPFYVLLVLFIAWSIGTMWAGSKEK